MHPEVAAGAQTPQRIPAPVTATNSSLERRDRYTPASPRLASHLPRLRSGRTSEPRARSSLPFFLLLLLPHRINPRHTPMDRLSRPASPGGGGLGYASRRGLYAQHHQAGGSAQTSPGGSPKELSPVHRHARAGSLGGAGAASTAGRRAGVGASAGAGTRAQNARAAAQRLARVMGPAGGDGGSGSDDDDDGYELSGPPIELSNTPRRTSTRSPSPSVTIDPRSP